MVVSRVKPLILLALVASALIAPASPADAVHEPSRLLVANEWTVRTVLADGSDAREVARGGYIGDAAWGPHGEEIAYSVSICVATCPALASELRVVGARGGGDRPLLRLPGAWISNMEWSPDGRWIAFIASTTTCWGCPPPHELHVVSPRDGTHLTLGPSQDVTWSPDSRRLALVSAGTLSIAEVVAGALPVPVAFPRLAAWAPAWSPDGARLAFLGSLADVSTAYAPEHVWIVERDGSDPRELATTTFTPVTWSPDSRSVASITPQYDDIEVSTVDGQNRRRLGPRTGLIYGVAWSPDGGAIAYRHHQSGEWRNETVRAIRPDGGGDRHLLDGLGWINPNLSWSR